jgi:hypothetical protein
VRTAVLLVVLVVVAFGAWYFTTHHTGDWIITVDGPDGKIAQCYQLHQATVTNDIFNGTVSWTAMSREYRIRGNLQDMTLADFANGGVTVQDTVRENRFPKNIVNAVKVNGGLWMSAYAAAGVDGALCTNGPYPDRVMLAKRAAEEVARQVADAMRRTAQALQQKAPELQRQLRELGDQAGKALQDWLKK